MPCLTATGRDGVLMPVNKQKTRAEGGERGAEDEKLHHIGDHMAEDDFLW